MASQGPYDSVAAVRSFGHSTYGELSAGAGTDNIVASPLSILFAILLTYIGAEGQTKTQIEKTIATGSSPRSVVLEGYTSIMRDLFPKGDPSERQYQLTIANNLYVDKRFPLQTTYFDQTQRYLGVRGSAENFQTDAAGSTKRINQWAARYTNNTIKEAVPTGMIRSDTAIILINAIHFKSNWAKQFDSYHTKNEPFNNLDNSQSTVPMMKNTENFMYSRNEEKKFQYIELPYEGKLNTMIIVLPDADQNFAQFEKRLNADLIMAAANNTGRRTVRLSLPKFKFDKMYDLKPILSTLGMERAFSDSAEFPNISTKPLKVTKAVHKAFIDVNEAGTEAAAVTSMALGTRTAPYRDQKPVVMTIDRPFLFAIRNNEKKVTLFSGRVAKL